MRADRLQAAASTCSSPVTRMATPSCSSLSRRRAALLAWTRRQSRPTSRRLPRSSALSSVRSQSRMRTCSEFFPVSVRLQKLAPALKLCALALMPKLSVSPRPACVTLVVLARAVLTVNPAVSALAAAGKVPMLKDNRFILQSHSSGSGTTLHALTVGYVGQLPGPDGKPGGNDEVLTVASPDLLAPSPEADPRMYELTYVLRRAEKRSLEDELTLPGVLSLPWLG